VVNNSTDFSFKKSSRLLDANAYKTVFDDAQLKVSRQQVLFLSRPNERSKPRIGLVIAKKNIRHANQRNRIKRILRESFRLHQHQLSALDTVVLARRGLDKLDNAGLHKLFTQLWQQLQKKAENKQKIKQ
jgi:ribonuclease P protein component